MRRRSISKTLKERFFTLQTSAETHYMSLSKRFVQKKRGQRLFITCFGRPHLLQVRWNGSRWLSVCLGKVFRNNTGGMGNTYFPRWAILHRAKRTHKNLVIWWNDRKRSFTNSVKWRIGEGTIEITTITLEGGPKSSFFSLKIPYPFGNYLQ